MDTTNYPVLLRCRVKNIIKEYTVGFAISLILLWWIPEYFGNIVCKSLTFIIVANIVGSFVENLKRNKRMKSSKKAVFISGCDSGFGYLLAKRLDELGFQVFAGCLFPNGKGAEDLKKSTTDRIHVVHLDVTKAEKVTDAYNYVTNNLHDCQLWAVVCNAGVNEGSELSLTKMESIERIIDVNTLGAVRVAKAFLPQICRSRGRVVVVSSAAGRYTLPGMVPYSMSKHALTSFCDGLRLEMYRWGVQVVSVEPYTHRTNITNAETIYNYARQAWEESSDDIKRMFPDQYCDRTIENVKKFLNFAMSSDLGNVVNCIVDAVTIEQPRYRYNPGKFTAKVSSAINQVLPKPIADAIIYFYLNI